MTSLREVAREEPSASEKAGGDGGGSELEVRLRRVEIQLAGIDNPAQTRCHQGLGSRRSLGRHGHRGIGRRGHRDGVSSSVLIVQGRNHSRVFLTWV